MENNIINDSFYFIKLFNNDNKKVTQLQILKLMYIFEGFYLNVANKDNLYECNYQAWNFGPVAIPLYKHYKKYGRNNIVLSEEENKLANEIEEEKKYIMDDLYRIFKNYSAMDLVNFTHVDGSPWKKAWDIKPYSDILKSDIKEWFSKYVKIKN